MMFLGGMLDTKKAKGTLGGVPLLVFLVGCGGLLADGAGAEVAGVGDFAFVVGAGADGEAPDVDAVAVPVGGDGAGDGLVGTHLHVAEHAGTCLGAVDEEVDLVAGVGTDDLGAVGHGDFDAEWVGEGGGAELCLGEVAHGDDELGVVDGGGTWGVGVDAAPVFVDEDVAFGGALATCHLEEADADGGEEGAGEAVDGAETGLDEGLCLRGGVGTLGAHVGAHDGFAFPKGTDDGSDFSIESIEDSHTNFSHSDCSFWLVKKV